MSETSYADLPKLAGHLRAVLANKAQKKPGKSPFVLLYAFNGTGKTRLSTAFKDLGKVADEDGEVQSRDTLYFNAFTEDLFSWDNDLENDEHRTLKLNATSSFFVGLNELEIENRIRPLLDRYADFDFKIGFEFDDRTGKIAGAEVTFSRKVLSGEGDEPRTDEVHGIKISRGEETSLFLGHRHFSACIKKAPDDADGILHQRFVDLLSHGKYSMYEPTEMGDDTKDYFLTILRGFVERHPFNRELVPEPAEDTEES